MSQYQTSREVADSLGLKSREVTCYAKKYGLLPAQEFGGAPMWTQTEAQTFAGHRAEMLDGLRCTECGRSKPPVDAQAEDAPPAAEGTDETPDA